MTALPIPSIDQSLCNRCGRCIAECPTQAVTWVQGAPAISRPEDCVYCGLCEELCPTGAIALVYEIVVERRSQKTGEA